MIIGLTGKTGSGKSTAARIFEEDGFFVLDFDRISRDTTKKGSPCLDELVNCFGKEIITSDGELDRKLLGQIVFSDSQKLARLNEVSHKYILEESEKIMDAHKGKNLILDAPLLFEAGLEKRCDFVVGVIAPIDERVKRICKRDGIDKSLAMKRINNQKPDSFFRKNCDFIIENNKDTEHMKIQIQSILRSIFNDTVI